jgi:YgiT-type zinc finger domain-containing protein
MRPAITKTAIWIEEHLFVVEDIPAMMCDSCIEQFYDEETTDQIRRLKEDGFPADELKREVLVPIYSLEKRVRRYEKILQEREQNVVLPEA